MTTRVGVTADGTTVVVYDAELIRQIVSDGEASVGALVTEAETARTGAEAARDATLTAETNAEAAEALAEEWASNPEDDEITGNPGKFSALHWSAKAQDYRDEALGYAGAASTSATQAATSATAAQTAETGAEAAQAGTIAAIAGAGGTLGDVTLEAATIAILEALDTATGSTAFLTQAGRGGLFELVDYAANAALVDADTVNGVFVRSTDDIAKAWKRVSDHLVPEMFGCPTADDTNALRIMGYLATELGLPMDPGLGPYRLSDRWRIGSLTAADAPDGATDGLQMTGLWRFILTGTAADGDVQVKNSNDILLGDFDFDLVTDASPVGAGGVKIMGCNNVRFGTITKTGVQGNSYPTGSGQGVALQTEDSDLVVGKAVVSKYPSSNASAVFTNGTTRLHVDYVRGVECQDACDLGGAHDSSVGVIEAEDCVEALDCGNSARLKVGKVISKGCATAVTVKTETTKGAQEGSNDVTIDEIHAEDYVDFLLVMSGGTTGGISDQTLHNLKVGKIIGRTTVATASTIAIRAHQGDDAADPTKGLNLPYIDIEQNLGSTIELAPILNFSLGSEHIRSTAPQFLTDSAPVTFLTKTNGYVGNFIGNGDFITNLSGMTVERGELTGGTFRAVDTIGGRYRDLRLISPPVDGFDLEFTVQTAGTADKDIDLENIQCVNMTAAGRWALRVRAAVSVDPVEGVRIDGVGLSGTPAATAARFTPGTFNKCELRRVVNQGLTAHSLGMIFTGLNSFNDPNNRIDVPTLASAANAVTLTTTHAHRTLILSHAAPTLTIPPDSTTAFPIGTIFRVLSTTGIVTAVPGSGVTITGATTSSGANGVLRMEKTAANAWLVTREG